MVSVAVLGVNHKTAEIHLRERVACGVQNLSNNPFFPHPIVILSTCNRTEIYFSSEDLAEAHSHLLSFLRCQIDVPFEQALYSFFGIDCFFHLCKVAAGLDSAIFAESEIQGQVRVAYARAKRLPSSLHFVFQKALKISKEIRSCQHAEGTVQLYRALWHLTEWRNRKILLVGFSQITRGLIAFLHRKEIYPLTLVTRSPDQVRIEGVRAVDRSFLAEWGKYDVIVCGAKSEEYLIQGKGSKTQVIFDLSVPRNVDPKTEVKLYNIEEIHRFIKEQQKSENVFYGESLIWKNVIRLAKIFRSKTQRGLDILGTELHL